MLNENKDKKFESQEPVQDIEKVLADMDSMARGVIRYGMEATGICDLTENAAERLDVDWHDEDPEVQKAIDDERMALEEAANECCSKIIDAIDLVWPVSKLTLAQRKRLEREIEDLNCYGARPFEDPHGYVGCVVADYALHDDAESLNNLEFACENALEEEDDDEDMDESVKKGKTESKKNSRRICESVLSDMDGEVRQWAVDHIIDRLDEMEDMEVELSDLAHELVDRENIDGVVFYNNQQAWEWVSNHRYDAGDVLAMMCNEWGTCSPNPLIDPDAFCVVFLEEAIADVLEDSATVQDGGKVELTREVIDAIVEEIQ